MYIDEAYYLEHFGVKGMHWGVRGTARAQRILDRQHRQATGTASTRDKLLNANRMIFTAKGADRVLQRGANNQAKINAGKMQVGNALSTLGGVKIKNLDFHKTGDAKAKLDRGQKAGLAILAGLGAMQIASGVRQMKSL